jgi:DNA-binding NtrC family response regulator
MNQGHGTILLVEDDTDIRVLARDALRERGFTVLEAGNGREAREAVSRHTGPIDLLLTDVILPGVNGKVLAEELLQRHPDLKVIYMSGYSDEILSPHGILQPGIHFLQKPFSMIDLVQKIRRVLG